MKARPMGKLLLKKTTFRLISYHDLSRAVGAYDPSISSCFVEDSVANYGFAAAHEKRGDAAQSGYGATN